MGEMVEAAEKAANVAVANAKKVAENSSATETQVKASVDALTKQQAKLTEAQKTVTDDIVEIRKAGPSGLSYISDLQKLSQKIKTTQTPVNMELNKAKSKLGK